MRARSAVGAIGVMTPGLLAALLCLPAGAQEIAPFRMTGYDGYVGNRVVIDDVETSRSATSPAVARSTSSQRQIDVRPEVFVMTHNYVYHPNFLTLDLGGGPALQYGSFAIDGRETEAVDDLYSFSGRAELLREKPYRGTVFVERVNPTLSVGAGEVLTQRTTRYGIGASVLDPVTPVPINVEATHSDTEASGAVRSVDDRINRIRLTASRAHGDLGSTELRLNASDQLSRSGNLGLAVQRSRIFDQGGDVVTRLRFGKDGRHDFSANGSYVRQRFKIDPRRIPEREAMRVALNLTNRHSERLTSHGRYQLAIHDQGLLDRSGHNASIGVTFWPRDDLSGSAGLRAEIEDARQASMRAFGGDGSVRYKRRLPVGSASLGYRIGYELRKQSAARSQTEVFGERLVLDGTNESALRRDRIAVSSIVVSNATRTQAFVEGIDYEVAVVGRESRLRRLITGNIRDGEEILVDYLFDTGGSFTRSRHDHGANASWRIAPNLETYYRYFASVPTRESGTPTFILNTVQSHTAGARGEYLVPWFQDLGIGGSVEYEDRSETIASSTRRAYEIYLRTRLPLLTAATMRVGMRQFERRFERADSNSDVLAYDFRLAARSRLGIHWSADASYEEDTGKRLVLRRASGTLRAGWRFRRVSLALDVARVKESQGPFERIRTRGNLMLRRDL